MVTAFTRPTTRQGSSEAESKYSYLYDQHDHQHQNDGAATTSTFGSTSTDGRRRGSHKSHAFCTSRTQVAIRAMIMVAAFQAFIASFYQNHQN